MEISGGIPPPPLLLIYPLSRFTNIKCRNSFPRCTIFLFASYFLFSFPAEPSFFPRNFKTNIIDFHFSFIWNRTVGNNTYPFSSVRTKFRAVKIQKSAPVAINNENPNWNTLFSVFEIPNTRHLRLEHLKK